MLSRIPRLAAALAVVLLLTGCSLRWDSGPPQVPEPSPAEQARQAVAEEAAALVELAAAVRAEGETARLVAGAGDAAAVHLDALGGLWQPWPGGEITPTARPGPSGPLGTAGEPSPGSSPESGEVGPQDVLDALVVGAASAREAALAEPGELGQLLASVALSRGFAAVDLAGALDVDVDEAAAPPTLPLPEPADGLDRATLRTADAARYALEVVAARSQEETRELVLDRVAELESLVAASGQGGEIAYDVGRVLAEAPSPDSAHRHLAAQAELDLLAAFLGELAAEEGPDRETLLAAAAHAATQARAWDAALPPLPGLTQP